MPPRPKDHSINLEVRWTKPEAECSHSVSKVKSGFANVGVGISAMAGITTAAWSLFNAYDSLQDAEVGLQRKRTATARSAMMAKKAEEAILQARQKITDTSNAVTKAEQALAAARAKGDPTAITNAETALAKAKREAADATRNLPLVEQKAELARRKAKDAADSLAVSEGNLREAQAQFYTSLLPMVATLGGSFAPMMALSAKRTNEFGAALPGATKGVNGMSAASKLLHFALGPIGLILIGIGTALALVATNAFGIRDRFNEFGKALGDALPFLRPVLELIKSLGGALGILGPESAAAKKNLGKAFGDIQKQVSGFVTTAVKKLSRFGQFFKDLADLVVAGDFKGALNLLKGGITEFTTFVKNRFNDIKGVIVGAFKAIGVDLPGIFGDWGAKLQNAISIMASYFQGLWNQAQPYVDDLTNHVNDAFTALTKGDVLGAFNIIKSYFQGLAQQAKPWIDDLTKHVHTAFAQLKAGDVQGAFDTMKGYFQGLALAAKPLIDDLKEHVLDAFKAIGVDLPKLGEQVVKFFTEEAPKWGTLMVEKFFEGVKWIQDNVWPVMQQLGDQISRWMFDELPKIVALLPVLFFKGLQWAQENVWPAFAALGEQIGAWITANGPTIAKTLVDTIGAGIRWLQENVEPGFRMFLTEAGKWINEQGPIIGALIADTIGQFIKWTQENVAPAMESLWNALKGNVSVAGPDLGSLLAAAIAVSIKFTEQDLLPVMQSFSEQLKAQADKFDQKAFAAGVVAQVDKAFKAAVGGLVAIGQWILEQITGGATGAGGGGGGGAGGGAAKADLNKIASNFYSVIKKAFDTHNELYKQLGNWVIEQIVSGFVAAAPAIKQMSDKFNQMVWQGIQAGAKGYLAMGQNILNYIRDGIVNAPGTIMEFLDKKVGEIGANIQGIGAKIWESIAGFFAGKSLMDLILPGAQASEENPMGGLLLPPNAEDWKTQFAAITAAAQASATAMATAFTTAAATALENVAGIKLAFTDINTAAGTAATTVRTLFQTAATGASAAVQSIAASWVGVRTAGTAAADIINKQFQTMSQGAQTAIRNIATPWPGVYNAGQQAANTIMNAFGNMANNAIAAIKRIQAAINALKPKTINIPVTDNGSISRVQRNINNVRGKTVYIDVRQRLVGPRYVQHGFHQLVTKPTMFIAGEKRPEMVNVTPTTNMQQPTKTAGPRGSQIRHAPLTLTPARGGGGVMHHTTVLKIGEREWKRHTDDVLLDGTEAHY